MMGNTSLEQAIYLAIDYIRKVQHQKSPYSENIVDTVAKKYGLNETKVKKQLDHLVETGAIYITVMERGDSYFIFDPENMEFKETDFQDLSMDDLSLDFDFGNSKNLAETKDGHSTETKDIHTQVTNSIGNKTLATFETFGKMADAILQMNTLLQVERDLSNNLCIENIQLKSKIGELETNSALRKSTTPSAVECSSSESCSHHHRPSNGRLETKSNESTLHNAIVYEDIQQKNDIAQSTGNNTNSDKKRKSKKRRNKRKSENVRVNKSQDGSSLFDQIPEGSNNASEEDSQKLKRNVSSRGVSP